MCVLSPTTALLINMKDKLKAATDFWLFCYLFTEDYERILVGSAMGYY